MAEKGLSPDQVQGTGRDGRVMKEDVARAASAPAPAPAPATDDPSALEARIDQLEEELAELRERLDRLEGR